LKSPYLAIIAHIRLQNHSPFVTVSPWIQLLTLHGFRSNLDNSISKETFQTGSYFFTTYYNINERYCGSFGDKESNAQVIHKRSL